MHVIISHISLLCILLYICISLLLSSLFLPQILYFHFTFISIFRLLFAVIISIILFISLLARLAMPNYGSFVPDALRESDNAAYAILGRTLYLPPTVDPNDVISDLVPLLLDGDHAIIVTLDYVIFNWYKRNLTHFSYVLDERVRNSLYLSLNNYHIEIAHSLTVYT